MKSISNNILKKLLKQSVPQLTATKYKGQAGKICVIGGSKEYTGAPYFAAISALYCGADLVHIICPDEAASVIKTYSPELIVHPILNSDLDECKDWIRRMHAVVIGPGLGRQCSPNCLELIEFIKECGIPLVIDADGINLVAKEPSKIQGYRRAVITPNIVEMKRLMTSLKITCGHNNGGEISMEHCRKLSSQLGNVTVVMKGQHDSITNGINDAVCSETGSPRRCGGQGDLLSGTMALFLHWTFSSSASWDPSTISTELNSISTQSEDVENLVAANGACALTRICARLAFQIKARATTTTNMIDQIGIAFSELTN